MSANRRSVPRGWLNAALVLLLSACSVQELQFDASAPDSSTNDGAVADAPQDTAFDIPPDRETPDSSGASGDASADVLPDSAFEDASRCDGRDLSCDGIDDDCDGAIDEEYRAAPCTTGAEGMCEGITICESGSVRCRARDVAASDDCDGRDDDCDGAIDEDFDPACVVGACPGIRICSMSGDIGMCRPSPTSTVEQCSDGADNDCDGEVDERDCCFRFEVGGAQYAWCQEPRTYEESQRFCENARGHLVSIETSGEQRAIELLLSRFSVSDTWIGLLDRGMGFEWASGAAFSFENWAAGEPNESRRPRAASLRFTLSYGWRDSSTSQTLPFLCEFPGE